MDRCSHCEREIRETSDPGVPFVHVDSGNSYCDVVTTADAVDLAGGEGRTEATPAIDWEALEARAAKL